MTPQEWNRYVDCVDCLQVVNSGMDPVFRVKGGLCLCLECGVKRGGSYDAPGETWVRAPNLGGLS
jgi:hypothetical protein